MTQTNTAVRSQRIKERPAHPLHAEFAKAGLDRMMLDDFPSPPWAARAWCEYVVSPTYLDQKKPLIWECAANRGYLASGLEGYGATVIGSDIFDYASCYPRGRFPRYPVFNFLDLGADLMSLKPGGVVDRLPAFMPAQPHWVISNPPFSRAHEFIELAMKIAKVGVSMLCRIQITESVGRYEKIFKPLGARRWAWSQFVERVPIHEGKCERNQSTMTAYGWLTIWQDQQHSEEILAKRFIPPCRARLEKADDYR